MERVVVVGGGVLGTMHAVAARRRGLDVLHIEREPEPRGASVRNFGLIWVSGRAAGPELSLALRARAGWEELAADVPGLGFRPHGSLTLASSEAELQLLKEAAALPDAPVRGYELIDAATAREVNPALRGEFAGALRCSRDAIVEPRLALRALREHLLDSSGRPAGYGWRPGREATEIAPHAVRDHTGEWHRGDLVVVCTGAAYTGVAGPHLAGYERPPVRRVRLQMLQTLPFGGRLTTSVADGDSLRYYPAFDLPGRPGCRRRSRPPPRSGPSCCWSSGWTAASPSATPTPTTSRSPSMWTRTRTTTCGARPRSCSAPRCRAPSGAGPAYTARSPAPSSITDPRSPRAWSWSPAQAAGA